MSEPSSRSWSWSDVLREAKRWANYDGGAEYDTDDIHEPVARETVVSKFAKATGHDKADPEEIITLGVDTGELIEVEGGLVPAEAIDREDDGDEDETVTDEDALTWRDVYDELGREPKEWVERQHLAPAVGALTDEDTDGYEAVEEAVGSELEASDGGVRPTEPARDAEVAPETPPLGQDIAVEDRRFYPDDIQEREIWVSWSLDDEGRKRPRAPWLTGHCYPAKWKTPIPEEYDRPETNFEEAHRYTRQKGVDLENAGYHFPESDPEKELNTGIILPADRPPRSRRITLIDWDDVRDPETGHLHPTCAEYLRRGDCYAEISQSGKGVHQFVVGGLKDRGKLVEEIDDEPFGDFEDAPAVEIYDGGRHVAMTGRHVEGTGEDLVEGQDVIDEICERFGGGLDEDKARGERDPETVDVDLTEIDEPEELPECARRLLEARVGDNAGYSTGHELNLHAALLVMYSGFDLEDAIGYFEKYPPNGSEAEYDEGHTEKALRGTLEKIEEGNVAPVGLSTLRENAVFGDGETCDPDCPIHGSDGILRRYSGDETDAERHQVLNVDEVEKTGVFEDLTDKKRHLRRRGELPTTREVRDEIDETVKEKMKRGKETVVEAPTSAGKSYTVATTPWRGFKDVTDGQPVVQLHKTKDARREKYKESREGGVAARELVGRTDERRGCPIARGDLEKEVELEGRKPSEWIRGACEGKGLPFSLVHAEAVRRIDEKDPTLLEDEGCPDCPPVVQHEGVPRNEDGEPSVDVIHATHEFAYVSSYLMNCNVVLDEQPDYKQDLSRDRVRRAVTAFLQEVDAPLDTFERLLVGRGNEHLEVGEKKIEEALDREPSKSWYFECDAAHALAPALARAVWYAHREGNGRKKARVYHEPPRFDDDDGGLGVYVTLVLDDRPRQSGDDDATVFVTPNFGQARSVVGLDARPCMENWRQHVAPDMGHDAVLDPTERRNWRFYERGLRVVQIGEATRPVGSEGEYFDEDGERAVVERLIEEYGEELVTFGTGKTIEDDVREIFEEGLETEGDNPETVEGLHFGEEKSRNVPAFVDAIVGYVTHCIDPGDDAVLDLVAARGLDARPERSGKCDTCDGDGCHECDGTGRKRAHGRGFVGPDADKAADVLASVRENHVAQMIGRYARDPTSDDATVVFVRTDAVPEDLVDVEVKESVWTFTEKQSAVLDALETLDEPTAREIHEEVRDGFETFSKQHVAETLRKLEAKGHADRDKGVGSFGGDEWGAVDEKGLTDEGVVDLSSDDVELEEIVNEDVWSTYTWSFTILSSTRPDSRLTSSLERGREDSGGVDPGLNRTLEAFGGD